jgi:hypothetical protein
MVSDHIGNELPMMLAGSKPLSSFAQEPGMSRAESVPAGFDEAVAEGRLVAMTAAIHVPGHSNHYFALPREAWRLAVMRAYNEDDTVVAGGGMLRFNRLEHQQFLGLMLGYTHADTHSFVKRTALQMHDQGELSARDMAPYIAATGNPGGPAVRIGAQSGTDVVEGRVVLRTGRSMLLSVAPADQWRAKVVASALDGVATWKHDYAVRDEVAALLAWVVEPEGDEVDDLMRWAEHGD